MKIIKNNNGMTLIEILIASVMAIICMVVIITTYMTVLDWSAANREETIAMLSLTNMVETIKSTPFSGITGDFPDGVVDGPTGNRYDAIVGGYTLADEHITVSYVGPVSDPLEISVEVRWKNVRNINRARYLVTKRTK